ncbi:HNH endonuclease family protein [Streptomyces sp. NPDC046862]|uniref:HNH endonuclease family protein n=1 Tax=Streptomyces sp. NPDC046862 TaxID=3154603 RepID=UPI003456B5CE
MVRLRGGVAVAALVLVTVSGCKSETAGASNPSGPAEPSGGSGAALTAVDSLTVKGRAPKTGYERDNFGTAWADTDSNHCDTRDDILKRDLKDVKFKEADCEVASGVLNSDPYSGKEITFKRGHSEIDIDHLVPLSDAWQKGAQQWDASKRIALANDPLNLLAVDAGTNRSKGDGDTATWLPPNKSYRCTYVAAQVAVKKKYGLWVTTAEKAAMKRVLSGCPDQSLPSGGNPTKAPARFHAD